MVELLVDQFLLKTKLVMLNLAQFLVLEPLGLGQIALAYTRTNREHILSQFLHNLVVQTVQITTEMLKIKTAQL